MKRCCGTHPVMLRSHSTDESCKAIFACRNESACFAALLVLLLGAAMGIDRLTGQEKTDSAEVLPFFDTTSGTQDDDLIAAGSSVAPASSSSEQLIHFGKIGSTGWPSLLEDYGRGSL